MLLVFDPSTYASKSANQTQPAISTSFSSLIYIGTQIRQTEWLDVHPYEQIMDALESPANRMLSHMQYLTFLCDPFYITMRGKLVDICGVVHFQSDEISVTRHRHLALQQVATGDTPYKSLLRQYIELAVSPENTLLSFQIWHPKIL